MILHSKVELLAGGRAIPLPQEQRAAPGLTHRQCLQSRFASVYKVVLLGIGAIGMALEPLARWPGPGGGVSSVPRPVARLAHLDLTQSVCEVILRKSIPAQIRERVLHYHSYKE